MNHSDFFSNFFVVEDPASKKSYRGHIVNEPGSTFKLLRAEYKTDHLDIMHLEGSNEPGSLFWNMVNEPFCVSRELAVTLREAGITGWTVTPVNLLTKSGDRMPGNYSAVSVTGRANAVDYLKTDIVFRQFPGGQFPYFKGLYFDPESWDGSDIFMERPDEEGKSTAIIFVTKKFVDTFKKNKVKNIGFVNFNDYLTDCDMIKIGATDALKRQIDGKIKSATV